MRCRSSSTDDMKDHLNEVLLTRLLKSALQERGVLLTEKGALVLDSLVGTALKLAADIREIEGSADPFVTLIVGACADGNAPSHTNIADAFAACSQIQKKFLAHHLHFSGLFTIGLYSQDDLSTTFAEQLIAGLLSDSRELADVEDAAGCFVFAEGERVPVRKSVDKSSCVGSADLSSPVLSREDLQTQLGALLKCVASWDALHPDIQVRTSVLEDPSRPLEHDFQGFAAVLCGVLSIGVSFTCSLSLLDPRILEFRSYSWTAAMRERLAVFSEFELLVFWLRSFVGFVASCRALKRQYGSFQKWSSFFGDVEFDCLRARLSGFYTNYTLRGPSQKAVAGALAGRKAMVSPESGGCVVAYDEASADQPREAIAALASHLSATLHCPVLAVVVHGDVILWY